MFGTGTLIRTLIPRGRTKKWTSILPLLDNENQGSDPNQQNPNQVRAFNLNTYIDSNINVTSRNVPTIEFISNPVNENATSFIPAAFSSSVVKPDIHMVCFNNPSVAQYISKVKSTVRASYPDAKIHDYPYDDNVWPQQLMINVRDAAIVVAQFPDIYKPNDILVFVHAFNVTDASTLAEYTLDCINKAISTGSSVRVEIKNDANNSSSVTDGNSTTNDEEHGAKDESKIDENQTENALDLYQRSFAIRCDTMLTASKAILGLIKDDEENESKGDRGELANQILLKLVNEV